MTILLCGRRTILFPLAVPEWALQLTSLVDYREAALGPPPESNQKGDVLFGRKKLQVLL